MGSADSGGDATGEAQQTPLIDEHRRLGARMIEFAGWEMPVWYPSVSEEHAAVREAAGLFDIGHMGVVEIAGLGAVEFLDRVTTAKVGRIRSGRCHYTFVLDRTGLPIDDIILYHMAADRFVAVVNAANHERVWAWLTGFDERPELRDLTDPAAGPERLCGMALQGPASARVLAELADGADLAAMRRFAFVEATVAGAPALVSRTGYTGEAIGFELFVHPERAPHLWGAILEAGAPHGVLPAGLGARDSTRIEAGLPLYGHELAGSHEITPMGAGYERFVALDKPDFVGREGLLERERERRCEIVRFRLDDAGARAIRTDDPVAARRDGRVGHELRAGGRAADRDGVGGPAGRARGRGAAGVPGAPGRALGAAQRPRIPAARRPPAAARERDGAAPLPPLSDRAAVLRAGIAGARSALCTGRA